MTDNWNMLGFVAGHDDRHRAHHPRRPPPHEAGFTIVEAVVAMALFAVILAGTGAAVVRSLAGTGSTNRAIAAVMVANEALEAARTTAAQVDSGGHTGLVAGRSHVLVDAVRVDDVDLSDTQITYSDQTTTPPAVPLTTTRTVDGVTYTVRTIIGTCQRDGSGGACDLATDHVNAVTMYRVVAAVTWPACTARECPVKLATLEDVASDPAFNPPVAYAKCFRTSAGRSLTFDPTFKTYTLRDSGDLGDAPVQIVTPPDRGTLTPIAGSAALTYAPGGGGNYDTSFSYRLVDRYNRQSDPATITVQVGGQPC